MLQLNHSTRSFKIIEDTQDVLNSVGLSDDDVFEEMKLLLSSSESPIRKIAGHILLEIAQDKQTHQQIICSGCIPQVIQNTIDIHCGSVMASLLYKLSSSSDLTILLFQHQLFRTLLQNTRDSDSKEWNYKIFMSLINISHDLTPLYEIDSSMFLLYQYVKSVLSIFQKSFSDEKDLSIDDILEDDHSSIQETYSLFMLESLPKCVSQVDIASDRGVDTIFLPPTHSCVYLLFSLVNVFEQSSSLIESFSRSNVQLNSLFSTLQLLLSSAENYQSSPDQNSFPPHLYIICGVVSVYYCFMDFLISSRDNPRIPEKSTDFIIHSTILAISKVLMLESSTQYLSKNSHRLWKLVSPTYHLDPSCFDLFSISFQRISQILELIRTIPSIQALTSSNRHLDDLAQSASFLNEKYQRMRRSDQRPEKAKEVAKRDIFLRKSYDSEALQEDDRGDYWEERKDMTPADQKIN